MFFGGGVTEEGRRAAAVSTRTLCRKYADLGVSREMIAFVKTAFFPLNYPVKPFCKRKPSLKTLFRHTAPK